MNLTPLHIGSAEGNWFAAAGDSYRTVLTGAQTGGTFTLVEIRVLPGGGPPPHLHRREEETFFVLEGQVSFWIDGRVLTAGPGDCVFGPRNIPHRFFNASDQPVRLLVLASPSGLEEFFQQFAQPLAGPDSPPPPVTPEVIGRLLAVAPDFGIELLPPPA
jgi:mannose-6-phosphate isomerase-like protein (cupin superfamily)